MASREALHIERTLGSLETGQKLMLQRLDKIESKVDSLQYFKWKTIGVTGGIFLVLSLVFKFAVK